MPIALPGLMQKRLLTATLLSTALALGAGVPAALAAPPPQALAAEKAPARTAPQGAPADRDSDERRYAAAEHAQPGAADFEGGAAVIVVGGTTLLVAAIILLIVLL
jgi:hypothetical protein